MPRWYQGDYWHARTAEDREAAFEAWAANTPEWVTPDRDLWMRRYTRPLPPAGMPERTLNEIRDE